MNDFSQLHDAIKPYLPALETFDRDYHVKRERKDTISLDRGPFCLTGIYVCNSGRKVAEERERERDPPKTERAAADLIRLRV